mgnify:CR=1 FL=1
MSYRIRNASVDEAIETARMFLQSRINEKELNNSSANIKIGFNGDAVVGKIEFIDSGAPIEIIVNDTNSFIEFLINNTKPDKINESSHSIKFEYVIRNEKGLDGTEVELAKIIEIDKKDKTVNMYAKMVTRETTVKPLYLF